MMEWAKDENSSLPLVPFFPAQAILIRMFLGMHSKDPIPMDSDVRGITNAKRGAHFRLLCMGYDCHSLYFLRLQFAICVGLMGSTGVGEARPQEPSDLDAAVHDLRKALTDLDDRLRRLEQLIQSTKSATGQSQAIPSSPPETSTNALPNLVLSQEAYQLGRVAEERQHYEPAIEAFSKAIQFDPGNDSAFLHRGRAYFQLGNLALALSDLNQSLVIQPGNARAYELRANIERALRAYDSAIGDLGHALEHDPGNSSYLSAEAGIEEERGDFAKALESYARALSLDSNSSAIHLLRASVFRKLNQIDNALQECTEAVQIHPSEAQGYVCRADAYVHLGRLTEAITDVNQAIRINPMVSGAGNVISAVWQQMLLGLEARELSAASRSAAASEDRHSTAVDSVPARQAHYYTTKGRAYTLAARYDDAIESLTTAIERDPSSAVAYNSRGYAYLRTRNYKQAIDDFSSAIRLEPTYTNAYLNRAVARRLSGDTVGAQQDLQNAALLRKPHDNFSSTAQRRR